MNVLPVVMTFLFLIAIATYSRLQVWYSLHTTRVQYAHFMEYQERAPLNRAIAAQYDDYHVKEHKKSSQKSKIKASSKVCLKTILDQKKREGDPGRFNEYYALTKEIIHTLYDKHPFYQELSRERPYCIDELVKELMLVADMQPKRIKTMAQLGKLRLQDSQLNDLLYYFLKGYTNSEGRQISLEQFFTLDHYEDIRLYLASRPLLLAIYQDVGLVEEILSERKELYRAVRRGVKSEEEATAEFSEYFGMRASRVNSKYLNYSVTETNPKYYE